MKQNSLPFAFELFFQPGKILKMKRRKVAVKSREVPQCHEDPPRSRFLKAFLPFPLVRRHRDPRRLLSRDFQGLSLRSTLWHKDRVCVWETWMNRIRALETITLGRNNSLVFLKDTGR